ncbi:hypothetical protein VaNZ11_012428 [Volvox africanus]|uniref:RRM domain-containing protein n=1 Tax=Volvox africanus TaxID=51714 RepID=A0ABQ5SDV1_9CHLO|nr:hypothetical protein VaNZ11_012428 [Volvox africanus]
MDTAKLAVEFARKVGDEQLPRAWSKHTTGTTANRKLTGGAGAVTRTAEDGKSSVGGETAKGKDKKDRKVKDMLLPEEVTEDPKLQEFLALMQPRFKAKIWGNDEVTAKGVAAAAAAGQQAHRPNRERGDTREHEDPDLRGAAAPRVDDGDEDDGEDDQYQDWTDVAARARRIGLGDGSEEEEEEEKMVSGSDGGEGDGDGGAGKGGRDEVVINDAVSDLEYLRSRMRRWDEEEEDEEKQWKDGKNVGDGSNLNETDRNQGVVKGATEAAARGDQTGVGTSPRCEVKAAGGGKKAGGNRKAAAAAAAAGLGLRELAHVEVGATQGGDGSDREGSHAADANGDVDMEDAAAAPPPPVMPVRTEGEAEGILETGRLFVRNLAYTATETDLSDLFGTFGNLQEVHLVMDRETKRSKGLAYVQYQIPEDAVRAAQQLDGTIYQGRLIHILAAKPASGSAVQNTGSDGGEEDGPGAGRRPGTSSFKAQREAQRKADAGNRAAWNTLFMRPDTVADAVAAHYGLSKAALLDPSATGGKGADSVAVRMALGEAQVIAATKQALAEAGVSVEALERAAAASGKASTTRSVARSSTTLLVKNLPFSADEDELAELFGRCGLLARLVLPPARALALVEFTEAQDARAAFRSLAYKKYQHVPLYLEWAPADVFTAPPVPREQQQRQQAAKAKQPESKGGISATAHEVAGIFADGDDAEAGASANPTVLGTIYVKNLAFATSDGALRKHFDGAVSAVGGSLHSAVVARKKAMDGALQSLGYGFVEVDSEEIATAVIKKLQGSQLDGHKLVLQLSRARKAASAATAGGSKAAKKTAGGSQADQDGSTKLVVRNLAFEATKKDIQGLFNPFGHLKSCRLPKKFDGSHRGFAFVEFVTKQEAQNALEGVGGTHLYGRRLVVEYAREEDTLDDIRNKTAAKFKRDVENVEDDAPAKRLKV